MESKKKIILITALVAFTVIVLLVSGNNENNNPPVDLTNKKVSTKCVEIPYKEIGSVKTIPVELDGVTLEMIFDTGCGDVLISVLEAQQLYKNGTLNDNDFLGYNQGVTADGSIMVGCEVNLRSVQIGGDDGVRLNNVKATMTDKINAPLLIGNSVFDEMASVEVDNVKKVIRFNKH